MVPNVHGIIVNWNGRQHLEQLLPSVLETRYPMQRWTILDNASTDGSREWASEHFPMIPLHEFSSNLGFAAANNWGIRAALAAETDYVVLLNNDTRVDPYWLDALVSVAEADSAIAICQARQLNWVGDREIRFRLIPEWAEVEHRHVPVTPPGPPSPTPFASGCAMLLRASALRRIDLFDERYFMYVEDVDIALRAWIAGYRVMEVPQAIVYHRMYGSAAGQERRMFWGYRNQLTTLIKLYQPETLREFAEPIARRWFRTRNRYALQGSLATFAMLRGTLARRRQVQQARVKPDRVFLELCSS